MFSLLCDDGVHIVAAGYVSIITPLGGLFHSFTSPRVREDVQSRCPLFLVTCIWLTPQTLFESFSFALVSVLLWDRVHLCPFALTPCSLLVATHMILGFAVMCFSDMTDVYVHTFAPWHGFFWFTMQLGYLFQNFTWFHKIRPHIFSSSFTSISCIPGSTHTSISICLYQCGSRAVLVSIHSIVFVYLFPTTCISFYSYHQWVLHVPVYIQSFTLVWWSLLRYLNPCLAVWLPGCADSSSVTYRYCILWTHIQAYPSLVYHCGSRVMHVSIHSFVSSYIFI